MSWRRRLLRVGFVGLAASALYVFAVPRSAPPVEMHVVEVVEQGETKRVTVEFRRLDRAARFNEAQALQVRVQGKWMPPCDLAKLGGGYLLARTNCQRVEFEVPRQTQACRLSLGYRVGPRPSCQAYFFLSRYGISKRFPGFSKALLRWVPQQPRLRRFECELEMPAGSDARGAAGRQAGAPDASVPGAGLCPGGRA